MRSGRVFTLLGERDTGGGGYLQRTRGRAGELSTVSISKLVDVGNRDSSKVLSTKLRTSFPVDVAAT